MRSPFVRVHGVPPGPPVAAPGRGRGRRRCSMSYERAKRRSSAHRAALLELAARHEAEFARIYAGTLKAAGIDYGGSWLDDLAGAGPEVWEAKNAATTEGAA